MNFKPGSMYAAAANQQYDDIKFVSVAYQVIYGSTFREGEGMQQPYNMDLEFANTLRMIAALTFVPPGDVVACFEKLTDHMRNVYKNESDYLLNYFEDIYIGPKCSMTLTIISLQ